MVVQHREVLLKLSQGVPIQPQFIDDVLKYMISDSEANKLLGDKLIMPAWQTGAYLWLIDK